MLQPQGVFVIGHVTHSSFPPSIQLCGPQSAADDAVLETAALYTRTGLPVRAHEIASEVLERARARRGTGQIARATLILSATCLMTGKYEAGIAYGRESRLLFSGLGEIARAARAGANLAWLLALIGEEDAVSEAMAALDAAERSGDPTETIWALDTNAIVLWLLQQFDQALPFAERAVELSRMHRPRLQRPLINLAGLRVQLALKAGLSGQALAPVIDDALALTAEALALARRDGDGWLERLALCNIAEYRLHVDDAAGAQRALGELPASAGEMSDRCRYQYMHMQGRVHAAQGRPREAIETLTACVQLAACSNDLETASPCYRDLAELHAGLGEFETALNCHRAFHDLYTRQASQAAQRRARLTALEREAQRLRASITAVRQEAADLSATNRVLAQETERLLRASMEDPLTGLQNRRRLDLAFLDLLASGKPYAMAMIDVDHFKRVNDTCSHPVGDAVLRAVADLLRHHARTGDLTVRFGGDEFAILLAEADVAVAATICDRLMAGVASRDWRDLHPHLSVTLSIGIAASHEAERKDDVLALADNRLYRAKREGRNRLDAG